MRAATKGTHGVARDCGAALPARSWGPALALPLIALSISSASTAAEEGGHTAEFPHQTIGVFLGDTTQGRREGGTLGLEYEYRFDATLGLGAIVEHVFGDFDASVFVLPTAYHRGPWKLYAGPGIEYSEEGSTPLMRVGVEYGFHVADFEVSPQIDLDFIDGERLFIFGVVIAHPF